MSWIARRWMNRRADRAWRVVASMLRGSSFRPPKIDGKPQIGVWVAFRLDVVQAGQEDR
jgi:hypothetical protein